MDSVRIFLFGSPRIEHQGKPVSVERRKALFLVAYLAMAEQRQSREALTSLFWPELDHVHARSALRSTLHSLTRAVPLPWIDTDAVSVALKRDMVWVDVDAFIGLLVQRGAHSHARSTVCAECVKLNQQAIELYQADFLAGYNPSYSGEFDNWQRTQRQWLRWEFMDIQRQMSEYYGGKGEYDLAIRYAQQWLSMDPLDENAHRQLMRLHAANGQRTYALRQFEQCVKILDEELATPPDAETRLLYESIQNQPGAAKFKFNTAEQPAAVSILPPLPPLITGRNKELEEIKRRLGIGSVELRAVTVIQGWPGVGKSTLLAKLAHDPEVAGQFPDGIFWASLGESPDIYGEISAWADALLPGGPGRIQNPDELRAQLTAVLRDRRSLLLLDDVWQIEHVQPFRVGGQHCALVITSRLNDVSIELAPTAGDIYRLPVLSEEAGLDLLGKLAPQMLQKDPRAARELVHDLEGLPLAIHVAGRLLQNEARLGWGLRELLAELRSGAALLNAPAPSDMHAARQAASPTVAALLRRSTDLLDEETRRKFACLGLFVPKPATFDLQAMAVAWGVDDPRPAARLLVNRGLLEPVSGGRFQMHALLVMHARSLLDQMSDGDTRTS